MPSVTLRACYLTCFIQKPPQDTILTQLISAPNKNHEAHRFSTAIVGSIFGSIFEPIGQKMQYLWRDGSKIFSTDTRQLRLVQSPTLGPLHIGPQKWTMEFSWFSQHSVLWALLWKDYQTTIANCFLWQLMY